MLQSSEKHANNGIGVERSRVTGGSPGRSLFATRSLALALLVGSLAYGQFDSATVLGTVRDAAQASVGAANVTLVSVGTSIAVSQETEVNGDFRFVNVRPGAYT